MRFIFAREIRAVRTKMGKICKRLHSISCENNITAIDGKPQSPCNTKFHRLDSIPPSSIG